MMKYVFVTGGVVSSLGTGTTAASLGRLLKARGYKVAMQKCDTYYNFNPALLSPLQHGENFITEDGVAADLDLGHYERFIDESLKGEASITTGKIHTALVERELRGEYHGATITVVPHVTNEIKHRIITAAENSGADIAIIEIGGVAGDIESSPYLEAIRQLKWELGAGNTCFIHVALMPYLSVAGEMKTKPTQHSVKALRAIGIQPDVIVCRTEVNISQSAKDKIALFCNVPVGNVVQNRDASTLFEVPLNLEKEGLAGMVLKTLKLDNPPADLTEWTNMVARYDAPTQEVHIALVGKYVAVHDAYLSVHEALVHAGIANLAADGSERRGTAGQLSRHHPPRRLRAPWRGGDDGGGELRAHEGYPLPDDWLWNAAWRGGSGSVAFVAAGRELDGSQSAGEPGGGGDSARPRGRERWPAECAHGRHGCRADRGQPHRGHLRSDDGARAPRQPLRGG